MPKGFFLHVQRVFCDFNFQQRAVDVIIIAQFNTMPAEGLFQHGIPRKVDGDRRDSASLTDPFLQPQTDKLKDEEVNLTDRLRFFQQRDEGVRGENQILIQLVPYQRFRTDQLSSFNRDLWLKIDEEAAFVDLLPQDVQIGQRQNLIGMMPVTALLGRMVVIRFLILIHFFIGGFDRRRQQ